MTKPEATFAADGGAAETQLHSYSRLKLALGAQVRLLRENLKARGDGRRAERCDALMTKLAEDRFTLAVLGQFKRGKSSLMNAVIGREILPVGLLPLTSAITVLRFGPRERLLVRHSDWAFLQEAPLEDLPSFVTEKGNPGNRRQVQAAYLEMPLPFLRRGLEFVDTPGIGSAIQANTATTYGFLPACDAAIFVTSADSPLTEMELEFLRNVRAHVGKLFFVVNKIDLVDAAGRAEVADFAARTLRREIGLSEVRIFPVSARAALAGKTQPNPALYAESGLAELENALAAFLAEEKSAVLLTSILEKAERLLRQELTEADWGRRSRLLSPAAARERREALKERLRRHDAERESLLGRLREAFVREALGRFSAELDAFLRSREAALPRRVDRLLEHSRRRPALPLERRLGRDLLGSAERQAASWCSARLARLAAETDPAALDAGQELQRHFGAILPIAAEAAGIRASAPGEPEPLPAWQPPSAFAPPPPSSFPNGRIRTTAPADEAASPPSLTPAGTLRSPTRRSEAPPPGPAESGRPRVGALLAWLPVRLARGSVRAALVARFGVWARAYRQGAIESAERSLVDAFAGWAAEVAVRASEIGARAEHILAGSPPPGAAPSDAALDRIRGRLARLRAEIVSAGDLGAVSAEGDETAIEGETAPEGDIAHSAASSPPIDLARDLKQRGCPVCEHLANTAFDFCSRRQYALYTDEAAQQAFAADLGLCAVHLWQLESVSSPLGMSAGHAKLVERVSRLLEAAAGEAGTKRATPALPSGPDHCRLCRAQDEAERAYVAKLAAFVREPAGREAYAASQGLCLRHLAGLTAAAERGLAAFLLGHASRRFAEFAEDMQGYAMKTEALRRSLRHGDEEDAYWRALTHLAGSRMVCLPWNPNRPG